MNRAIDPKKDWLSPLDIPNLKFRKFGIHYNYHGNVMAMDFKALDWEDANYVAKKIVEQLQKDTLYEIDAPEEYPSGRMRDESSDLDKEKR